MMGYVFMRFGTDFRPENVDRLRLKVGECLDRGGITGSTAYLLLNLMDELICNILEHSKASWVELEMHPEPNEVHLIFRDDGSQFNPGDSMGHPSLDEAVESDEGRRMGLYMVSQIARSWDYQRLNGTVNELKLSMDLAKEK
jgi:anti-sigma regulatory factor (Ser/Thr protein kinase)